MSKVLRVLMGFALSLAVSVASAAPPLEDFFKRSMVASPKLSPDGARIAMLVPAPNGRRVLAVAPTDAPSKRVGVARFDDADIRSFHWVNDRRLVFDIVDLQSGGGQQRGAGLYAADIDGSDFMFLVARSYGEDSVGTIASRPLRFNHVLVGPLRDGSDDVLVTRYDLRDFKEDPGGSTLMRLNTRTRATRDLVERPPANAAAWVVDKTYDPRAAVSVDGNGMAQVWARENGSETWSVIDRFDLNDPPAGSISPVGFDSDGSLLVTSLRDDSAKTLALFRYDLKTKKRATQPILALKGHDFTGQLIFDRLSSRLLGATYLMEEAGTAWLDPDMKVLQQRVDDLLPNTVNQISCERCLEHSQLVVTSWSDRQPPLFFLLNRNKTGRESLTLIGASRPWIDPARMARQERADIVARDGLSIPTYITKPSGKGPWPTVVLVHGGPYVRGVSWGWSPDAQFLASRGYLVVEPEFRGSTGYGDRHFRAGWRQWGLKMQDDITDATRWVISQGLSDPKRIAIAGASYGGYAAMMGLVREPDLYRAGINWVGVTDIELLYSVGWSDQDGTLWQRVGMPKLIGDPKHDRLQLDSTSPLKRAAEITKPVLMAYGIKDLRVPLPHGTKMRDALRAVGRVEVEWIEYPDEGHGWLLEKNSIDFWSRVEKFLARHLR